MKNRILTFIIGLLTGIIITISMFLIYIKFINDNHAPQNINQPNENIEQPPLKPEDRLENKNISR